MQTGKPLFASGTTILDAVHFGNPVLAPAKQFRLTHDAHIYDFDL
jgi:hypothetical protein